MFRAGGPSLVAAKIYARFGSTEARAYRRAKAVQDKAFDGAAGVDTGGIQHPYRMRTVSDNAGHAISHIASPPDKFAAAIAMVDLPLEQATFVDLGSGKGRAVIMASALPFRRLIGVEFATPLHEIAQQNFARLGMATGPGERVELMNCDATQFGYPQEQSVLFLFHPFDRPIITMVARASLDSWRRHPRPIRVLYLNPVHLEDWLEAGWQLKARQGEAALLAPPEG